MPKKRKRPGRHTVHTKDPRYNVKNYPRGKGDLVTRHGVTKSQHAWDVDDGMIAEPVYPKPTDAWRTDHNRSDVQGVDALMSLDEMRRWARYPVPTEAVKTDVYKKRLEYHKKQGHSSAYSNELAIKDAIRALRLEREEILKKRLERPKKKKSEEFFAPYEGVGGKISHAVKQGFYHDSIFYNFDLSHVKSRKAWRGFLRKHGFKKVADDPDKRGRKVYRTKGGVILVVYKEAPMQVLVPKGRFEGWKTKKTNQLDLGYMRFEAPKSKRKQVQRMLKDFRGPRALKGTDIQGDELGGIATYVKQEEPNTKHAVYI